MHITFKFYVKCQIIKKTQTHRHTTGMINKSMKISKYHLHFILFSNHQLKSNLAFSMEFQFFGHIETKNPNNSKKRKWRRR